MPFRGRSNSKSKRGSWRGGFQRGRGGRGRNFNKFQTNQGRPKSEYSHQDQLTEEEVGISQYISKIDGYPAIIKARFSDFQVNEINLKGRLAKLTDISLPTDFATSAHTFSYEDTKESPSEKISQDNWEALKKIAVGSHPHQGPLEIDADNLTKDERKTIHQCVKSYFGQEIVASTIPKDGKSILQFKKWDKKKKDDRIQWPEDTPEFVYFIVYKEMTDTIDACFKIAQALKISPSKITYAGVKDRRGKTTQWFCIRKYNPAKLVSNTKIIRQLRVGNIEFHENCLKIGQLKGNRFRVALRNVVADDDLISSSLIHLKEHGFINYYGLQRFGNDKEAPTYLVGIKLLLGEWKEAVKLILKVKAADDPSVNTNYAKKVYAETGDAAEAVKFCDKQNNVEKKLLQGLAKHHENDYVTALENVPRAVRLMYIHAYQSLIWNILASKRIQEFGFKPVEGDLIFIDDSQEERPLIVDPEEDETENLTQEAVEDISENVGENVDGKLEKPSVRPLMADELEKYTIFDVVLPLPGHDIIYPTNLTQYYKEAIEECGLTLEMPKQKVKTYNLSGTYRKLIQQAKDLDWKIMYYNDPTDNLIRSDLEELKGEEEPKSVENGKYKALVIAFTLNAASYATMLLREILKCNTSTSVQASSNNYGETESNKSKVILDSNKEISDGIVDNKIDEVQQGSLLADTAKYEDFKNNIFGEILGADDGESKKRDLEAEEKSTYCKKIKTDDE